MTLAGETLYVFDHNGRRLAAVGAETGKVRWHRPIRTRSDAAFAVKPLVARGYIYVASDGYLHSISVKGKPRWQVATKGTALNGIARSRRHIIFPMIRTSKSVGLPGVHLWSVNARSGRVEWTRKLPGALGYVRGNSDGVYYISDNGMVMGLTPDRGEPQWQLRVKGRVSHPPILKGGKIYVVTERRKAGWSGSGIYVVDALKGKLLWQRKVSSTTISPFLLGDKLGVADGTGLLTLFNTKGKPELELKLDFGDPPQSLAAAAADQRLYLFSYHPDGNGYVHLIDLPNKRVLAKANALDLPARSILIKQRIVYIDGGDGQIYAYRLNRSEQPKRRSVPAEEFAAELLAKAEQEQRRVPGLAHKIAALGPKTITPLAKALASANGYVVEAAAQALGLLKSRRSVASLISALSAHHKSPPDGVDPLLAIVDALARIRDARAVKQIKALMEDSTQTHERRRRAYVALGAIGSSGALAPIWKYRATAALNTMAWDPQPRSASSSYAVDSDWDPASPPAKPAKNARLETAGTKGRRYALSLSPYLGGYNDVWISELDPSSGKRVRPIFTGLTKAEIDPARRIHLDTFTLLKRKSPKAKKRGKNAAKTATPEDESLTPLDPDAYLKEQVAQIRVSIPQGKKFVSARPVKIPLARLIADRDQDGLPDVVERRLQLCVTHPDCDGDGIKDGEDVNPLASGKQKLTPTQKVFREGFFAFYSFFKRRGLVVVDPGDGPSFELYGRKDPILSLRRTRANLLRKQVGLHGVDYVSFGGPYPLGAGLGDALPKVVWASNGQMATMGMDVVRSGDNAAGYNIKLRKVGRNWVVIELDRVWSTNTLNGPLAEGGGR